MTNKKPIKILIGGSPCTHWSIAQHNDRETKAEGQGWELFKNYLIAKEKFNPDFFLYENNKSAAQPIKNQICEELGHDLMYINSNLVSAQNRKRFYVFNWEVEEPEDRGIILRDIIESGDVDRDKAYPLLASHQGNARDYFKKGHAQVVFEDIPEGAILYELAHVSGDPVCVAQRRRDKEDGSGTEQRYEARTDGKTNTITSVQKDNLVAQTIRIGDIGTTAQAHRVYSCDGKSVNLTANGGGQGAKTGLYTIPIKNGTGKVYEVSNGMIEVNGSKYKIKLQDGLYVIRKLTPIECERLQTLPDNYTLAPKVSASQRYKTLGNGWTAEVIIHILQGVLKDIPRDTPIQVLSMYDGIATGRYCLDKMGFKNVEYHAYEIDKYAIAIAKNNYPDIIHHGDAFEIRNEDWKLA